LFRACSTTLTNLLEKPVQVVRFGGYFNVQGEMYEITKSVTDQNNWGSPGSLWAYELETRDGGRFWTGEVFR